MDDLLNLRAEIDGIDDALHDLLMRRAAVVQRVAQRKSVSGAGRLRPGREAAILRRLLARHHGGLPAVTVVRIWREVLAGSVAMQGGFSVAAHGAGMVAVAREQFGASTPLDPHDNARAALHAVQTGSATIAVLPAPPADHSAWWVSLAEDDAAALHVVAQLPFWRPRPAGAPLERALVVASTPPDASGADRTLLALRDTAALAAAELMPTMVHQGPGGWSLAELDLWLDPTDARLRRLRCPARVIGAYAVPTGRLTE